jgi:hypothetical protein
LEKTVLKTLPHVLAAVILANLVSFSFGQDNIEIGITPVAIQPTNGKLPSSVYLAVFEKDCARQNKDFRSYWVQITGGLSISSQTAGECVIAATIALDSSTPAGTYSVILLDSQKKPVGHAEFAILDTNASAIPSGLAPQVDVIWGVLSEDVCRSVVGGRVSKFFYCIEVKLGNNTGHPLQLAGIGFKLYVDGLGEALDLGRILQPNTSYASTRAVLLRGSVKGARNIFYHSVQAGGILMAAFTPYFVRPNAKSHYAVAASIASGALLEAFNIIAPDPVVAHLNNLDDESFRDSQVIPNNSHIRTMVFVEKDALTLPLQTLVLRMSEPTITCCRSKPKSQGRVDSSTTKVDTETSAQTQQKGPETEKMAMKLTEEGRDTVNNSEQRPSGFLGLKVKPFDPYLVKLALGDLVIVGDEIEYLQRVQVQSSSSGTGGVSVSPSKLPFKEQAMTSASDPQTVTVTNLGTAPVSGLNVEVTGRNKDDFIADSKCGDSLSAGTSCSIAVVFKPGRGTTGARDAALNIRSSGTAQTVALEGVAKATAGGISLSPSSWSFGDQDLKKDSQPKEFPLTNSGSIPLEEVSISVDADFKQTNDCGTSIGVSGKCNIKVVFAPNTSGDRKGTLTVNYKVNGTPQSATASLVGKGK